MKNNIELDPHCLKAPGLTMMISNTGHLFPCGQLNVGQGIRDPKVKELMKYTKVSNYKSLDEIISHPKWIEHFANLQKNIGPDRCFYCCQAGNNYNKHSVWTITNLNGEETTEK